MAETTLTIASRQYDIGVRDGDEAHLAHLARMIEEKARLAQQSTPGLTEIRTLLFAALFLADEVNDLKRELAERQESLPLPEDDGSTAQVVEALAERIEKVSARLAAKASDA